MTLLMSLFGDILEKSIYGACCICLIFLFRLLLKGFPKKFSYCLWAAAGIRLLFSFSFPGVFSLLPIRLERIQNTKIWENTVLYTQPVPDGVTAMQEGAVFTGNNAAAPVTGAPFSLMELAGCVWLIGLVLLICYGIFSYGFFVKNLKREKLQRASYDGYFRIYESDRLSQAFTLGWIRPCIYLPAHLPGECKNLIVLHELAHIRRRDFLWKSAAYLILCLHWFNPLVWAGFFCFCRDMEMSCDEYVLGHMEGDSLTCKKTYSQALLSMAQKKPQNLSPLFFKGGSAKERIHNILSYRKRALLLGSILPVLVLVLAVCFLLSTPNGKDTPESSNAEPATAQHTPDIAQHSDYTLVGDSVSNGPEAAAQLAAQTDALKKEWEVTCARNSSWLETAFQLPDASSYDITDPVSSEHIVIYSRNPEELSGLDIEEDGLEEQIDSREDSITISFGSGDRLVLKGTDDCPISGFLSMTLACGDLNGDGEKELAALADLGYNGGDGGYGLLLYTHTSQGWIPLSLPDSYSFSEGFPMEFLWDGSKMYLTKDGSTDSGLGSFSQEEMLLINSIHGIPEEETLDTLNARQGNESALGRVDALSGLSFYYDAGSPVMITKQYVAGLLGHSDRFGYLIYEWRLSPENTWTIEASFLVV